MTSNEIARITPAASLPDMVRYAEHLAHADLLPKQFAGKPANVLYALEYGRTLGITPVAAITGIHVIEGKPSASSGLIGGLVRQAGHKLRVRGDDRQAVAQIIRADDPDWTYEVTWTLERAATAGLCSIKDGKPWARDRNGKPTSWEKYPAAMLKARAITEVARDACEDVLFGLHYTPEELGVYVDQDGMPVDAPVQPLRSVATEQPVPADAPQVVQRDYLHEAYEAGDAEAVRDIWKAAKADGAIDVYLAQIAQVGKEKAAAAESPAEDDIPDAEVLPEDPIAEQAELVQALRRAAERAQLTDAELEEGFQAAYGTPVDQATIQNLRAMTQTLSRGAA